MKRRAFVIMPFTDEFRPVYEDVIRRAAVEADWESLRIDESVETGTIASQYIREIFSADLVVAEVSAPNPNVFYELGLLHALGKETLIVKPPGVEVPSDFVRTEYIDYDRKAAPKLRRYLDQMFLQAGHYETMADQLGGNPGLAIDYLKRAYLITGNRRLLDRATALFTELGESSDLAKLILLPNQA